MTLLIGTISDKHAVITADGLSRLNPRTGAGLSRYTQPDSDQALVPEKLRLRLPEQPPPRIKSAQNCQIAAMKTGEM